MRMKSWLQAAGFVTALSLAGFGGAQELEGGGPGGPGGGHGGPGAEGMGGAGGRMDPQTIFDRLDANKDGSITIEEFSAGRDRNRGGGGPESRPEGARPGDDEVGRDGGHPGGREGRDGHGGADGAGRFERGNFQEMMMQQMRDRLGVTNDDEWKILEPKLLMVMELEGRTRMTGMMSGSGGRERGGSERGGPEAANMPEAQALHSALEDPNAPAETVTSALQAYRDARLKLQDELKAAQTELRAVLTPRQEALLVMRGMLE